MDIDQIYDPDLININVTATLSTRYGQHEHTCMVNTLYSIQTKIQKIFDEILKHLNKAYYPIKHKIRQIDAGFTGDVHYDVQMKSLVNKAITNYSKTNIQNKGLRIAVEILKYQKQDEIIHDHISCPYMKQLNSMDPLKCPFYHSMMQNYQFNEENLYHIETYNHFQNEYEEKPQCKFHQNCIAYVRLKKGINRIDDKCHVQLYRHPPRQKTIKLAENIYPLIINNYNNNHSKHTPTVDEYNSLQYTTNNGFVYRLINEVIDNGFKSDLCLQSNDPHSILKIVDEKMNHIRHKRIECPLNRGEMLSLILYTGCWCSYDLCKEQRKRNYNKWKWLDFCLYCAIYKLSQKETGEFSVYSGLNNVQLNHKQINGGFFATYVSTSWKKEVAKRFIKQSGMIIQIDSKYKNNDFIHCCDVSWISKFPDECEILFCRSLPGDIDQFDCVVLDQSNGIQTISLKLNNIIN